jgi:hypothetical protein
MELFKASKQWAERPADERFWDLAEMRAKCNEYRASACEATVPFGELRVEADKGEVMVVGKKAIPARLTNWAFGQISARVGAPASYLRELPATLAAQNLNHGLAHRAAESGADDSAKLLFHKNGSFVLRAATSETYSRIWNADIVGRLMDNLPQGWRVPPARPAGIDNERTRVATAEDVLRLKKSGLSINVGDQVAPAGLYASDHDMFAFLVNEDAAIDDGTGHGLGRGFFIWNSEVGASSFGLMTFLYDAICGNHIVWGAKGVTELRVRHVGEANAKAFQGLNVELKKYADESASDLEAKIVKARRFTLGATKDEAITAALSFATRSRTYVTRKALDEAYDIAEMRGRYGAPNTPWGLVNGLTELSQKTAHADERVKLDRAAGKLLEIAF